ncbi:MAG: Ig-like domain-containing protein [Anaerovorax sp.]
MIADEIPHKIKELMSKAKRRTTFFITLVLIFALFSGSAFAFGDAESGGGGTGQGGGGGVPIEVTETYPQNQGTNFDVNGTILFGFSKNVINLAVSESNRQCFSMVDSRGNKVEFQVIMADDQIEPQKRRDIGIKPTAPLKAGETYEIRVSQNLRSKGGDTLAGAYTLKFTAKGATQEAGIQKNPDANAPVKNKEPQVVTKATEAAVTSKEAITKGGIEKSDKKEKRTDGQDKIEKNQTKKSLAEKNQQSEENKLLLLYIILVLASLAVLSAIAIAYARRKK